MNDFADSGDRTEFETGAHRDLQENKGRYDLLPFRSMFAQAYILEKGAKKYGDRNWEKGIPLRVFINSAMRHLTKWILGRRDEPHAWMFLWNVACFVETIEMIRQGELPEELTEGFPNVPELHPEYEWPEAIPKEENEE